MVRLVLTNSTGDVDITNMIISISWEGDYSECARSIEFSIISAVEDQNVGYIECELGQIVRLYYNGELLFFGYVFSRDKSMDSNSIDVKCFDRGIYLKKNEASYNFDNTSPESVTDKICSDFGIPQGSVAKTGIGVSRTFLGSSLYDIIMTSYTESSKQTGKKYIIRFTGEYLNVFEKNISQTAVFIEGGYNLINAAFSDSIENMVNRIAIYNKDDQFVKYIENSDYMQMFGVMQEYMKQNDKDDKYAEAQKKLDENGISRKVTVENIGDIRCITGNTVVLYEPYTGTYGSFLIDSDVHTWKNGIYVNKLTLNFKNIMDEKDAGSEPKE